MTSHSTGGRGPAHRALVVALAISLLAGLPVGAAARAPGDRSPQAASAAPGRSLETLPAAGAGLESAPGPARAPAPAPAGAPAPDPRADRVRPGDAPSQMYLDTVANERRQFRFEPGARVTVGFRPRSGDRWQVDGHAPRALPAGRISGAAIAGPPAAPDPTPPMTPAPTAPPGPGSTLAPTPDASPAASPSPAPGRPTPTSVPSMPPASPAPTATPTPAPSAGASPAAAADPLPIPAVEAAFLVPDPPADLAPAAVGMRREVYGFLPYWEVSDADTRLDFSIVTHLAYFSVGADSKGNLRKRASDGSLTTGWAGWTSSKMTSIINAAHLKRSRVTLTLSVFAWTSSQATVQKALLGSSTARLNLARQAAAAVRDRGADGINLDFEPLASGYEAEYVALVRTMRAELNRIAPGYHLSFDTLGFPGNYPLEQGLAAGGADAVMIMGYDYRTAGAAHAGSIDPLAGPAYDLTDTVRTYTARVPASRVILGIPYYGRAWSTVSDAVNAQTQTGAKFGYSSAVNYGVAVDYAAQHGRRYDGREVSAWVAYRKQTCTATYGCVPTWRQIYYDDAATLKARYDMVNRAGLRGTGIWALGYDGTRRELYQALADKFLNDTTPPMAGIVAFDTAARRDLGFSVRWTAFDDWSGIASYDVEVSVDGGAWAGWLAGTKATGATYPGGDDTGYAFRVRARDGKGNVSAWNVASVYDAAPPLAKGGFVRVVSDTLNLRSGPSTGASRLGGAGAGDIFAVTNGPVASDGYTWYEVTGPVATWGPVDDVRANMWIAVAGSGTTNAVARRAPNATVVRAGIRAVGFDGAGSASLGTSAAARATRAFSPNGDGSRDRLQITWNNRRAFDSFSARVLAADGRLLGSLPLATTAAGAQETTWDGAIGGAGLADGTYVIQLAGESAGVAYTWPAADPVADGLGSRVAVTIDRVPPVLVAATAGGTRLSPNGDGRFESATVAASAGADAVRWELLVRPVVGGAAGDPLRAIGGSGRAASVAWNGTADDGTRVPDGAYRLEVRFFDAAGNAVSKSWPSLVDTTAPSLGVSTTPAAFSPDGDGAADRTRLAWTASETATGTLQVLRGTTLIRAWRISGTGGAVTWNGRNSAGTRVRDGRYTVKVIARDALGNRATRSARLIVDRTVGWLRWSPSAFYPQDRDALAARARISVRVAHSASLTLRILDATGAEVRRGWTGRTFAPGTATWRWDGRTGAGALAPPGRYVAVLTAVGPYRTTVLRRAIVADAFVATPSTRTPGAGTRFSVTFRSVEPLRTTPTATFRQAGRTAVRMSITRLAGGKYRASVTVANGAPGAAVVTLTGRDTAGGRNRTSLRVTVP